jgi:general secretion pathway protein C
MMTSTTISSMSVKPPLRRADANTNVGQAVPRDERTNLLFNMVPSGPQRGCATIAEDDNRAMLSRTFAFVIWALVAGTAVFWSLRFFSPIGPVSPTVVVAGETALRGDLSRLLGRAPVVAAAPTEAAPLASSRFRLAGVMAPKVPGEQGLALISVDGNPARVYRVGARIEGDFTLREVSLRTATVASAGNSGAGNSAANAGAAPGFTLEMPLIIAAATGVLPPPPTDGMVPQAPPPAVPYPQQGVPSGMGAAAGRDALSNMSPPAAGRPPRGTSSR